MTAAPLTSTLAQLYTMFKLAPTIEYMARLPSVLTTCLFLLPAPIILDIRHTSSNKSRFYGIGYFEVKV
jgi:hypothetical protein